MHAREKPFAILFKAHFWDRFVDRQFQRLKEQASGGDLFVLVDETKGRIAGVPHDRVFRITAAASVAAGYFNQPADNLFWYNTDYQLYAFAERYGDAYDIVFTIEFDCVIRTPIAPIVERMRQAKLAFVGEKIRNRHDWNWEAFARPYYDDGLPIVGRLLCCAAFETGFIRHLAERRLRLSENVRQIRANGEDPPWPNNEAFVGAEIDLSGFAELPFSAFGDVTHYDWAPAHLEAELNELRSCVVIHPVLDSLRFLPAVARFGDHAEDLFSTGSRLERRMAAIDVAEVAPMFLTYFAGIGDYDAVEKLRLYAQERAGPQAESLFNVARDRPATQSSTSRWSRLPSVAEEARGAVNGDIACEYGFHTDGESAPWWCVDLELVYLIRRVRLFNRRNHGARARTIVIATSCNLVDWASVYDGEARAFTEGDADCIDLLFEPPKAMRFLRVSLQEEQVLHMREIEIYV